MQAPSCLTFAFTGRVSSMGVTAKMTYWHAGCRHKLCLVIVWCTHLYVDLRAMFSAKLASMSSAPS